MFITALIRAHSFSLRDILLFLLKNELINRFMIRKTSHFKPE